MMPNDPPATQLIHKPDKPTTRQASKEATRLALVSNAHKLLLEEGLRGVSMKKICHKSGIAQPSFYNHYPALEHLLIDLRALMIERYLTPLQAKLAALVNEAGDDLSSADLRLLSRRYIEINFDTLIKDFNVFQEVLSDHNNPNSPVGGALGLLVDEINASWVSLIKHLAQLHKIKINEQQVRLYVDSVSSLTHAMVIGCQQRRYTRKSAINAIALVSEAMIKDHLQGSSA